jgi:anthranilate/para-aminobenzoate synthase component I
VSDAPFDALRATRGPCALLESTTRGPLARRSVLARDPFALLTVDASGCARIEAHGATRAPAAPPLELLRGLALACPPEGGVAGALAYDFARAPARRAGTPLLVALAVARLEIFAHGGDRDATPPARPAHAGQAELEAISSLRRSEYLERVARLRAHIAAGDIYQANLSQRFERPFARSGLDLYGCLRRLNPAPFSGYLRAAGLELVSASPERLLLVEGGRAVTRPIAGTRPRGRDERRDAALSAELLLSEKERAEHLMLVDLARNDLGRVAAVGSVRVDELMAVESYAHVHHIVSNVAARLAPGRDALDALQALFPGGTITGVPKHRCMQILDALEPVPRGFYTGSLFYLTPDGRLDANILIRSGVVRDGRLTFHAGGGIVADSDPEREYEETLHKAAGLRLAAELAEAADPS